MTRQLDLFAWADARATNVIDAIPALIRKAAREAYCREITGHARAVEGRLVAFPPAVEIRRIA